MQIKNRPMGWFWVRFWLLCEKFCHPSLKREGCYFMSICIENVLKTGSAFFLGSISKWAGRGTHFECLSRYVFYMTLGFDIPFCLAQHTSVGWTNDCDTILIAFTQCCRSFASCALNLKSSFSDVAIINVVESSSDGDMTAPFFVLFCFSNKKINKNYEKCIRTG